MNPHGVWELYLKSINDIWMLLALVSPGGAAKNMARPALLNALSPQLYYGSPGFVTKTEAQLIARGFSCQPDEGPTSALRHV